MIKAENLSKYYHDDSGDTWAVRELDLTIEKARFVSIVGRSGSGKSTLLKMLGGLLPPDEGRVIIDDVDLYAMTEKEMANYRCNKIGYIFQDYFLEEMYTVYQNIEIVLMISKVPSNQRREMIEQALESVDMQKKSRM